MREFKLLLFGLCLRVALCFAHAEAASPDAGHIGSALVRNKDSDFLTVEYVAARSPVEGAGIKKGDWIVAINGVSTRGMSTTEARNAIKGDIGDEVKLTIRRAGSPDQLVSITRRSLLDTYSPAAAEGDPRAEYYLADFFAYGSPPTRDLTKAVEWFRKAADQGYAPAQVNLGDMYRDGRGIAQDQVAAAAWFLKAATQGDAVAERNLAEQYYWGDGVKQNDREAFTWFYRAAQQDDPTAEQHLAFLYRTGRGVKRSDRDAFAWYSRSAQHNDYYGEWGLAYMYQEGLGVKSDIGEALKWYQKAHAGLPENKNLTEDLVDISLKAFLENPGAASLDASLIMAAFRPQIQLCFIVLAVFYVAGGILLFIFTFGASDAPPRLLVGIGWIVFYLESQGVAMLAAVIFEKSLSAGSFFVMIAIFSCLPVMASSCGPNRNRIWRASLASWRTLLIYGAGSWLAVFIISLGYAKIYALITHASLPSQPTAALIGNAKHASVWLAYATITLILPITEEIIFRGYFFDALQKRFSGRIAVFVSAFAFSLIHFQGLYLLPLFAFGLVLGWARLKTDSLRLPMFLHAFNNGLFLALAV